MARSPRSLKRSPAGSGQGPVIDAEWTPVDPTGSPPAPPPAASSRPVIVASALSLSPPAVRVPVTATATGRCPVCGRPGEIVTSTIFRFVAVRACRRCTAVGRFGAVMLHVLAR